MNQTWENVFAAETAHEKAKNFQDILVNHFEQIFPEKNRKISSDDAPWMTQKLKRLDRKRKRAYQKHRKSEKWKNLDKDFKKAVKDQKENFYKDMIADLRQKNPSQWYSSLKRITGLDQRSETVQIEKISNLGDEEQAEKIAEYFSSIPNEYEPLNSSDIEIPPFTEKDMPQFHPN